MIKYKEYMKIEFPSKTEDYSWVCSVVEVFAKKIDLCEDELYNIRSAVSEAIDNCIVHAYKKNEGIITIIAAIVNNNTIEIIIKDKGIGIVNVKKAMEPFYTTSTNIEKNCGMGLTVMNAFMTKCEVYSIPGKGTTVLMQKSIKK